MTESAASQPESQRESAPAPPRAPLGPLAGFALAGGILALAVGSFAMVFGATGFFCPVFALGLILVAQVGVAWLLGMPVKGPESPMGVPPDELDS